MTKERDYQELYDRLLEEVSTLHRNNRRRIRVGMRMLLAVTLGLMLLMFLAGGNKVFTLMLWILSMFAVAAYLIAVEYADYELQKKLESITQMEQESLGTLLELPELPKVPRMGLLLRHGTREEQETPETEATAAEAAPAPEETAAAAEDISAEPVPETRSQRHRQRRSRRHIPWTRYCGRCTAERRRQTARRRLPRRYTAARGCWNGCWRIRRSWRPIWTR